MTEAEKHYTIKIKEALYHLIKVLFKEFVIIKEKIDILPETERIGY